MLSHAREHITKMNLYVSACSLNDDACSAHCAIHTLVRAVLFDVISCIPEKYMRATPSSLLPHCLLQLVLPVHVVAGGVAKCKRQDYCIIARVAG
jgi:hypothetical protein